MCFKYPRIGIAMCLFYSILVPIIQLFSLPQNLLFFFIIVAILFNYGDKTIVYKPLIPFLFLYIAQFLLIPFHYDVPVDIQLKSFLIDVMSILTLPFAMINVMKHDPKSLILFRKTIILSLIIAISYSLFLLTMPGFNPYIMSLNQFINNIDLDVSYYSDYYSAEDQGRLFGRISGVFIHPMTNGLFLSIALIYLLSQAFDDRNYRQKIYILLALIVCMTIFFIGVRSAIGAIIFGVGLFLLLKRKINFVLYILIGGGLLYIVFQQIPGMNEYITSIFDSNSSKVEGSTMDMRISQFNGALNEIKNNPLIGKGYGWTDYYTSVKGSHPILLAFESLIYVVLCNNGFVGIGIWIIMIFLYFKSVGKCFNPNYSHALFSLLATYITYSIITGEYGYMQYFLIFYSLMWMHSEEKYSKKHQFRNTYE